jgi:Leucine-rich repeat (LRR) protein
MTNTTNSATSCTCNTPFYWDCPNSAGGWRRLLESASHSEKHDVPRFAAWSLSTHFKEKKKIEFNFINCSDSDIKTISINNVGEYPGWNPENIKVIRADHNGICIIPETIKRCTQLLSLTLSFNYIFQIENLVPLKNLRRLNLSSNKITKMQGLETLVSLECLELYDNQIEEIENINALSKLVYLDLSGNKLKRVDGNELCVPLLFLDITANDNVKIYNADQLSGLHYMLVDEKPVIESKISYNMSYFDKKLRGKVYSAWNDDRNRKPKACEIDHINGPFGPNIFPPRPLRYE